MGYKNLAFNVKYEFTDERIRICHNCKESFFTNKKLFCRKCGCFLPAKARVPEETCPLGRWPSADAEVDEETIRRIQQSRQMQPKPPNAMKLDTDRSFRDYCLSCPGPSGRHENQNDTFFKGCSICLLLGIRPDGSRQNLQDWWQSGGACPLGHWPAAEERKRTFDPPLKKF